MLPVESQPPTTWSPAQRNKAGRIQMSVSFRLQDCITAVSHVPLLYKFQALWLGNEFSLLILLPLLINHRFWKNHNSYTDSEHRSFPSCYQITLGILWNLHDSLRTSCPCLENSTDQQSKNSPPFIKHRGSLPYSKQRIITPYYEANKYIPQTSMLFLLRPF